MTGGHCFSSLLDACKWQSTDANVPVPGLKCGECFVSFYAWVVGETVAHKLVGWLCFSWSALNLTSNANAENRGECGESAGRVRGRDNFTWNRQRHLMILHYYGLVCISNSPASCHSSVHYCSMTHLFRNDSPGLIIWWSDFHLWKHQFALKSSLLKNDKRFSKRYSSFNF